MLLTLSPREGKEVLERLSLQFLTEKSLALLKTKQSGNMTKFNEGWWNCFSSFANELANVSSSASMVIRNVLDCAGVTKKEISKNLKTQHFDKRVVEELEEYKSKL